MLVLCFDFQYNLTLQVFWCDPFKGDGAVPPYVLVHASLMKSSKETVEKVLVWGVEPPALGPEHQRPAK